MQVGSSLSIEKPQNGLAGLKHWRHDLVAGLVVSLVSLPFSLGIAVASGAPPICGLISAIVAGLVLPFLGGSFVTISGPAAGLAPALLAAMILLGRRDLAVGYPLLLGAICMTGLVQVVLARFKMARFSAIFPASVVEGMLASIGLLIVAKQLPLIFGHPFAAHDFWGILAETPAQFLRMDPKVFLVGIFCLVLIFSLASFKTRWLRVVPPQVIAAVVGLILGRFLGLDGNRLIHIPDHPFAHGIVLPNFQGLFADPTLWWALATTVLTLTMIDGIESLATISAIDKIDPFRRKSDPNRTLFAMGVSNMCSSMVGGLTIIPGGVKSTTCILSGGRTQWANFYNALFLISYLLLGRDLINLIPYSALGAIVLYTGYKLCAPKVWKHVTHIGREQLFVFTVTVLVTVSTDLLWGIAAGIVAKLLIEALILANVMRSRPEGHPSIGLVVGRWLGQSGELFRDPVVQTGTVGNAYHLYFGRPLVCFNTMYLEKALAGIPSGSSSVYLHVTDLVTLIDHTAASMLLDFVEDFKRNGRGIAEIVGLDRLRGHSHDASCLRVSAPVLAQERAKALTELSRISLTQVSPQVHDAVEYLERLSLTHVRPIERQDDRQITPALIREWRYITRKIAAAMAFVRACRIGDGVVRVAHDRDLAWFSLSTDERARLTPDRDLACYSLSQDESGDSSSETQWFDLSADDSPQRAAPVNPDLSIAAVCEAGLVLVPLPRNPARAKKKWSARAVPCSNKDRTHVASGAKRMARRGESAVLPQVHRLFGVGSVAGLSEGQLLERFLAGRDEVAFEALVTRYGPMVLGVCRRVLADAHEAEDAFQATFLVLVRKAGTLRRSDLLEHWLYRVAYRVAARRRAESFRRRAREQHGMEVLAESREKADDLADLKGVLDREVGRLPEKYRIAIVLCDFEGRTNEEAARQLGCPVGTIRSRLSRGREHLRGRLTRLGLAPSAALLGAVLAPENATAAVPRLLIGATVLAARTFRAGKTATLGVVPASVLSLSEGVLQAMFLTKLKLTAAGLVAFGLLATGVSVLAQQAGPTTSSEADASRLKEVERKIDRLLNLLDRPVQPPPAPVAPGFPDRPAQLPPAPVVPVPPGITPYAHPQPGSQSPSPKARALPGEGTPTISVPSAFVWSRSDGQPPPADADRLATVERRLDQVEKKLDQVIRQIGGLKSEDERSPQVR